MQIWYNHIDLILIFVIFALSLNLLLGYAGQVSVAHAAFGAVGGYATGYMIMHYHWNFVAGVVLGMVFSFALGTVLALPALSLSVEYLILLTLAFSSVLIGVFEAFPELGGTYGLIGIKPANLFGTVLDRPSEWVILLVLVAAAVYIFCMRIGESPYGRVLKGLREDDMATKAMGKNVFMYKVVIFGVTSMLAGLAGGLYTSYIHLATPSVYGFAISLAIFAMVIFGGTANLTGSVLGAIVVQGTQPILERVVKLSPDTASFTRLAAYGLLLAVLMRLRPQGVLPEGFSVSRFIRRKPTGDITRVEMVKPEEAELIVPDSVEELVEAEHEYLAAGDPAAVSDEDVRHQRWEAAPIVLEVQGLTKRFGGITAVEDLDFQLRQGTITSLVGPNGAGKSTVFNLITGFIRPDAGRVTLKGVNITGLSPDKVAHLGMVRSFQDVRLFQRLSCLDNVAMGVQKQKGERMVPLFLTPFAVERSDKEVRAKAMEWLEFVGMQDFAHMPAGGLSYGQSKLISLARVLATDAEVLLLDEPASGIDTQWVETMLALIESLKGRGRTICIVEHNLHVVGRLADQTYFMELGRVTAEGTIGSLTSSPRLAEAYFGTL